MTRPVIAISLGDPSGIGPEIVVKAFSDGALFARSTPVVFGPTAVLEEAISQYAPAVELRVVESIEDVRPGLLNHVPTSGEGPYPDGIASKESGAASLEAIECAVEWCVRGNAAALVTAPINKESIGLAGSPYKGHTEFLRDLTQSDDVLMVLASETMRVGLVTIHIPVSKVAESVTSERIERTVRMAHMALAQDFGIPAPQIAVLGLNPHAGDGGYIGKEEQDIIVPVLARLRDEGMLLDGPYPADAYFSAHGTHRHDMIVAMYHDQGLIPLKMSAQGRAVNISCGLPIIRTSPDHGTAFDIAGKNMADPGSFIAAVHAALEMAEHRTSITKETAG